MNTVFGRRFFIVSMLIFHGRTLMAAAPVYLDPSDITAVAVDVTPPAPPKQGPRASKPISDEEAVAQGFSNGWSVKARILTCKSFKMNEPVSISMAQPRTYRETKPVYHKGDFIDLNIAPPGVHVGDVFEARTPEISQAFTVAKILKAARP
jgi:hypothetical protein